MNSRKLRRGFSGPLEGRVPGIKAYPLTTAAHYEVSCIGRTVRAIHPFLVMVDIESAPDGDRGDLLVSGIMLDHVYRQKIAFLNGAITEPPHESLEYWYYRWNDARTWWLNQIYSYGPNILHNARDRAIDLDYATRLLSEGKAFRGIDSATGAVTIMWGKAPVATNTEKSEAAP